MAHHQHTLPMSPPPMNKHIHSRTNATTQERTQPPMNKHECTWTNTTPTNECDCLQMKWMCMNKDDDHPWTWRDTMESNPFHGIHPPSHGIHLKSILKNCGVHANSMEKPWNPSGKNMESIHHSMDSIWINPEGTGFFWGLYSSPWVPADSTRFPVESQNSMEFHGISMESIWLEPQPFVFPFPWKFPLFSKEFQWKWLESRSLWEWFPMESMGFHWNSAGILLEFHGKQPCCVCQK